MHPLYNDKETRFVDREKERLSELRFYRITKKKDYQKCDPGEVGKRKTIRNDDSRARAGRAGSELFVKKGYEKCHTHSEDPKSRIPDNL